MMTPMTVFVGCTASFSQYGLPTDMKNSGDNAESPLQHEKLKRYRPARSMLRLVKDARIMSSISWKDAGTLLLSLGSSPSTTRVAGKRTVWTPCGSRSKLPPRSSSCKSGCCENSKRLSVFKDGLLMRTSLEGGPRVLLNEMLRIMT